MNIVKRALPASKPLLALACLLSILGCFPSQESTIEEPTSQEPTGDAAEQYHVTPDNSGAPIDEVDEIGEPRHCPVTSEPIVFSPRPDEIREPSWVPEPLWNAFATATHDAITLSWVQSNLPDVVGYRVVRWLPGTDKFKMADLELVNEYVDTSDVEPRTEYRYWIFPIQPDQLSAPTDQIRVFTPLPSLPNPPENVSALASPEAIGLNWSRLDDSSVHKFLILRRSTDFGPVWEIVAEEPNPRHLLYRDLPNGVYYIDKEDIVPGKGYEYRICAVNSLGTSEASPIVKVTVPHVEEITIPTPKNLIAEPTHDTMTLKWDAVEHPDVTGYEVFRRRTKFDDEFSLTASVGGTLSTAALDRHSVYPLTDYEYKVRAVSQLWHGDFSETVAVTTPKVPSGHSALPPKPNNLTAVGTYRNVILNWDPVDDPTAINYRLLRKEIGVDDDYLVDAYPRWISMDDENYLPDYGIYEGSYRIDAKVVKPETTYEYRVIAVNENGDGEPSDVVRVTTPAVPDDERRLPTTPFNLEALQTDEGIVLTWDVPDDPTITGFMFDAAEIDHDLVSAIPFIVDGTEESFIFTEFYRAYTYVFEVLAINDHGFGHPSHRVWIDAEAMAETSQPWYRHTYASHEDVRIDISTNPDVQVDDVHITRHELTKDGFVTTSFLGREGFTQGSDYFDVIDENVRSATLYWYETRSQIGDDFSEPTHLVDVTKRGPLPIRPKNATAAASHDRVFIEWLPPDDSSVTSYAIVRKPFDGLHNEPVAVVPAAETEYVDSEVAPNMTYEYYVRAINGAGAGGISNSVYVDTPLDPGQPPAPTNIWSYATYDAIRLGWDPVNDPSVTEYVIARSTIVDGESGTEELIHTGSTTATWVDTNVVRTQVRDGRSVSVEYLYKVYAANDDGIVARSNQSTTSRLNNEPRNPDPENLTAKSTSDSVTLRWDLDCDATYPPEEHRYSGERIVRTAEFPPQPTVSTFNIWRWDLEGIEEARTLLAEVPCVDDNTYVDTLELEPDTNYRYIVGSAIGYNYGYGATIEVRTQPANR